MISGNSEQLVMNGFTKEPEAEIYCDGASSGNPGHSGIGVVIRFRDKGKIASSRSQGSISGAGFANMSDRDFHVSEYIGVATNNVAEYSALLRGITEARALGLSRVEIFLDSELLVRQVTGVYKIKSARLRPLLDKARKILGEFTSYKITHVRREFNKDADNLAKKAVDDFKKLI